MAAKPARQVQCIVDTLHLIQVEAKFQ